MSNKKYVVRANVSYVHMEFEFNSVMGACNFMDLFIDHFVKGKDEVSVCMVRVDPEEETEEEGE